MLYQLAKSADQAAWFIVGKDIGEIADGIREKNPAILLLDGAYSDKSFVDEILHLRRHSEIDGDFSFVVTCWNGDREEFISILEMPENNIFDLDRLTQDEMVDVIANAGITDNTWLINEIVRQAAGLPGLAITLAEWALRGEGEKIRTAEALSAAIIQFYKQIIEGPVQDILACFALGGKSGMHKDAVSGQLDISGPELREALESLETGGIVAEAQDRRDHVKVRPDALRHALIRDVFLSGPSSLAQSDLKSLIDMSPDPKATAMELIGAKARGGKLEVGFLESYITQLEDNLWEDYQQAMASCTPTLREAFGVSRPDWLAQQKLHRIWEALAGQGYDEASWVIENFSGETSLLARPLLHHVPHKAIPKMLDEAIGDERAPHLHSDHPLSPLLAWVKSGRPWSGEAVQNRGNILRGARRWIENGGDPATGYKAMLFAMIPYYEGTVPKPGSGNGIIIQQAYLAEFELEKLQLFWKEIIACAEAIEVPDLQDFLVTIDDWANPFQRQSPPAGARELMTSFAIEMALDIKKAAAKHFGILFKLQRLMERTYPDLEIFQDDVIDALYPGTPTTTDPEKQQTIWNKATDKVVDDWIRREPQEVIDQLESLELEIDQRWSRQTPYLCKRLAEKTEMPLMWFDNMVSTALPPDAVMPFMWEAIQRNVDGWELALANGFATERLRSGAIQYILTCENVPNDLIEAALSIAGQYTSIMESLVRSNRLSRELVIKLFKNSDKTLVGKIAIAEWHRDKRRSIPEDIRQLWEQAVIKHCKGDYWLLEIFKVEAELALSWFKHRLADDSYHPAYEFRSDLDKVFAEWSLEARRNLLDVVPCDYLYTEILVKIIGDNVALYEQLINETTCTDSVQLAPLHRPIDSTWVSFANLAYAHGHAPEQIVTNTFMTSGIVASWVGKRSDGWKKWRNQFGEIRTHEDEVIREIAAVGYRRSAQQYQEELDKEHDKDVHGQDWG